jgi:hypothetical protein
MMKERGRAAVADGPQSRTDRNFSVTRHASAPIEDYVARTASGNIISPHHARRVRALRLVLDRAERRFLSGPFTSPASLTIDKAISNLEAALDEAEEDVRGAGS